MKLNLIFHFFLIKIKRSFSYNKTSKICYLNGREINVKNLTENVHTNFYVKREEDCNCRFLVYNGFSILSNHYFIHEISSYTFSTNDENQCKQICIKHSNCK